MQATSSMSIDLIYELLTGAIALTNSDIQIWTSFTFAVIVAVHLGGNRIGGQTYRLISGLYGLSSFVLLVKYCSAAYMILHYQAMLDERGLEPWPVPEVLGILIGTGSLILMVGGSIATLWFIHSSRNLLSADLTPR